VATFGRGFYILDDFEPLQTVSDQLLAQDAVLFDVRDVPWFVEMRSRHMSRGHGFWTAPNPPYGAIFTYYLREGLKTRRERRLDQEKEALEAGRDPSYPSLEELRDEEREDEPRIVLTVTDAGGQVVQRVPGPRSRGIHRVAWNLRYPATVPIDPHLERPKGEARPDDEVSPGPLALPGPYSVTMSAEIDRVITELAGPVPFEVIALDLSSITVDDPVEVLAFRRNVAQLRRAVLGAVEAAQEAVDRLDHVEASVLAAGAADPGLLKQTHSLQADLDEIMLRLYRDPVRRKRNIPEPPSVWQRVERIVGGQWNTTTAPTQTQREGYRWAVDEFVVQLARLRDLFARLETLETELDAAGGPWTPGRLPSWPPDRQ
jgi:hypothetical protein